MSEAGPYQDCCTSKQYVYVSTAIRLLGISSAYRHASVLNQYADRWMSPPWNGRGYYGSAYGDAMYHAFITSTWNP